MQPPTNNRISQTKHSIYNAVDYSAKPDPIFYAPENVVFVSYTWNGDCGNNLKVRGANGQHGFCHLEECYIKPGQMIRKGQALGKMGYTGKTIPEGPDGRHLHWVLYYNGQYVYPPSKITEAFNQGEMMDEGTVHNLYLSGWKRKATPEELKRWVGKPMQDFFYVGGKNQYEWLWQEIYKRDRQIIDLQLATSPTILKLYEVIKEIKETK